MEDLESKMGLGPIGALKCEICGGPDGRVMFTAGPLASSSICEKHPWHERRQHMNEKWIRNEEEWGKKALAEGASNHVTRRFPAYCTFEETTHPCTVEADFWKIDWVRDFASYPAFLGYFWETGTNGRPMLIGRMCGVKVPRNHVIAYFDYPPPFLPKHERSDYGEGKFPPWWGMLVFTKTCKRVMNDIWRGTIGRLR